MRKAIFRNSVTIAVLLFALVFSTFSAAGIALEEAATETSLPAFSEAETQNDKTTVRVSDVDSLLAAVAPDTEIVLEPGEYNLTQAKNYGRVGGSWYHWEYAYDGYELVITDLNGLTIRSEDAGLATISTEPRHANVLRFQDVNNVTMLDITVGHTKEQGVCSGGVLLFENSQNLEIVNCRLYGCGIRGVDLNLCKNVHVSGSDIYDCSGGCVYIDSSYNVLFEGCKFYFCQLWSGVFDVYSSSEVAVINSEVFGNSGIYPEYGTLICSNSQGVYLGGLDVHDNTFTYLFDTVQNPVTVEKSRFSRQANSWASDLMPVSAEGEALTAADLADMSIRTVEWTAAEQYHQAAPETAADGKVHVTNVDEFLAAIASNTVIYLEPGTYLLSDAKDYGGFGGECYKWENQYDGPELVIRGVSNLTIEGAGKDLVTIAAEPRYANVISFERTSGVILRNFTAGHTQAPGECSGGVISMQYGVNTNIEGCGLYGCGILGVWAMDSSDMTIQNTEIYECSSGAAWFYGCSNVQMIDCSLHDNGQMELYADFYSSNVTCDGKVISEFS